MAFCATHKRHIGQERQHRQSGCCLFYFTRLIYRRTTLHVLYHLAEAECWNRQLQSDSYEPDAFREEGFVHCCLRNQLAGVASRYYRNSADLILLVLAREKLHAELIHENTVGGVESFPHLYGSVNRDAIVDVHCCAVNKDGEFVPSLDEIPV